MYLDAQYDPEASAIADKLTFFCDKFELYREDITAFKRKKLIGGVNEDDLPESISCQVLVQCQSPNRAKLTFFNPNLELPPAVYENAFMNKEIIEMSKRNNGFCIELTLPLKDSGIRFGFSYEGECG